jgi:hypothetical protein
MKARRMGWAENVAPIVEKVGTYRTFVVKPKGRRPLGRSRYRRENNRITQSSRNWMGGGVTGLF